MKTKTLQQEKEGVSAWHSLASHDRHRRHEFSAYASETHLRIAHRARLFGRLWLLIIHVLGVLDHADHLRTMNQRNTEKNSSMRSDDRNFARRARRRGWWGATTMKTGEAAAGSRANTR